MGRTLKELIEALERVPRSRWLMLPKQDYITSTWYYNGKYHEEYPIKEVQYDVKKLEDSCSDIEGLRYTYDYEFGGQVEVETVQRVPDSDS